MEPIQTEHESVAAALHVRGAARDLRQSQRSVLRWRSAALLVTAGTAAVVVCCLRGGAHRRPDLMLELAGKRGGRAWRVSRDGLAGHQQQSLNFGQLEGGATSFNYEVPAWVQGEDSFDYSTISKADIDASADDSMAAGLPRDAWVADLKKELPQDVASSCDFTVDPCVNFYEFACGQWIKDTVIPDHEGKVLKSWGLTDKRVKRELRAIYEEEHTDAEQKRLNEWYDSCMDTSLAESDSVADVQRVLARVDAIEDRAGLEGALAFLIGLNLQSVFLMKVNLPAGHHDRYSLYLKPSGLTMADPALYLREDQDAEQLQDDLREHFTRLHLLLGFSPTEAAQAAADTLDLEHTLAKFHAEGPSNDDGLQSPHASGHYALGDVESLSPHLPWRRMFGRIKAECVKLEGKDASCLESVLGGQDIIVLSKPSFFKRVSDAVVSEPVRVWKNYLRTRIIYNTSPLLSQAFLDANFDLDSIFSGVSKQPPRWLKCVNAVSRGLPYTTNKAYLARHFSARALSKGESIVAGIKKSFVADLHVMPWLDNETRAEALKKAVGMETHLGSPDHYTALTYTVSRWSYVNNSLLGNAANMLRNLAMLDQVPDRNKWNMQSWAVNAYYDNTVNAIFIPAGIFQPPFFDEAARMEQNFGGVGAIVGHEITHGFDNLGSRFDADQNLRDWWTPHVAKEFHDRMRCIADLYSGFQIADSMVVGSKTLGENMADFGGTKIAHQALMSWHQQHFGDNASEAGERLFFISFGQLWCEKGRKRSLQSRVQQDMHSPGPFRANGVVSQNADFARVFGCPKDAPMNPGYKCQVWKDSNASQTLASASARVPRASRATSRAEQGGSAGAAGLGMIGGGSGLAGDRPVRDGIHSLPPSRVLSPRLP